MSAGPRLILLGGSSQMQVSWPKVNGGQSYGSAGPRLMGVFSHMDELAQGYFVGVGRRTSQMQSVGWLSGCRFKSNSLLFTVKSNCPPSLCLQSNAVRKSSSQISVIPSKRSYQGT